MGRPEVTLQNYEQVYQHYGQDQLSPLLQRGLILAISKVYRPRVHYIDYAKAALTERTAADARLLMACNHLIITDQFVIGAALRQNKSLQPLIGDVFIPSKIRYFHKPYPRSLLDKVGAVPVFRESDSDAGTDRLLATRAFLSVAVDKVVSGQSMLIFPEGTRNLGDATKLGKVHGSIGRLAYMASKANIPVSVVPMGLWFGEEGNQHWLTPDLTIGLPINGPFESQGDVTAPLAEGMAACLELSQQKSRERKH